MKHVIIAGTCRSGKTTLSIRLNQIGFNHYKMDTIKRAMCDIMNLDGHNWDYMSYIMYNMINRMIEENKTDTVYGKEKYVIDTCHLLPKDIKNINTNNALIVYLGYSKITNEEYLEIMRKYDKKNYWSSKLNDVDLLNMISANINYSKYIKEECKKLNIKYFDTSYDRDKTLDEAYQYILKKCEV